ncbi:N-6 DNA methylase [Arvimicrobium flavum]|uniref:N-6 DNA methylase n=1 Tax=Arvimicrobium flavum TaxID=3393320 RepID=UPI00237ADCFA|nr:N-6 DNA methylase [Mesorhizobium shangrilense]
MSEQVTMQPETHDRLTAVRDLLGYSQRQTYFELADLSRHPTLPYVVRQALSAMKIHGVFALEDGFRPASLKPIVYLASAESPDEVAHLRRAVWSQGVVPFLLIVCADEVLVCGGFQSPDIDPIKVRLTGTVAELPAALLYYSANRIASSLTWRDLDIHRDSSVDNQLVDAIEALNVLAQKNFPALEGHQNLINAVIGKFLYTYVLADRGILAPAWLSRKLAGNDTPSLPLFVEAIFSENPNDEVHGAWSSSDALAAFDIVDGAINGSVFKIEDDQRDLVTDGLCRLVHRVVRCGDTITAGGIQHSFFNVSFSILRTETISAIYERFIKIEDIKQKRDDGVFYTPPHLVDHVLDRVEAVVPITSDSELVDPAAGSGLFLVGAFRRLMERYTPRDGWKPQDIRLAKALLLKGIHGVELHAQAANVCRFSLYLTLLDYVGRATIDELVEAAGDEKFLPDLSDNVVSESAFATRFLGRKFTHVVGNPPWSASSGQKDRTNRDQGRGGESAGVADFRMALSLAKVPVGQARLSDLFFWLAIFKLAANEATVAMILPARSVIGRLAGPFAHAIGSRTTLRWIGSLFHLRRKLFPGVEASACVVVVTNREPNADDKVAVYRPLLSSLPGGRTNEVWSLLASDSEIQYHRAKDFGAGKSGWFTQAILSDFDRRMHDALTVWSNFNDKTLAHFLERSDLAMGKGRSGQDAGVSRRPVAEGSEKSVQIMALTQAQLRKVTPKFRGYFAGEVILVPRSMAQALYFSEPVLYPSTFNVIVRKSQVVAMEADEFAKSIPFPVGFEAAFRAFIDSGVVRYFASIYGASYLMDKARFEKNDLLAIPCPFTDWSDEKFLALGKSTQVDTDILDAMGAGKDFKAAFSEFKDFRQYFANAQCPEGSQRNVSEATRRSYVDRLQSELRAAVGKSLPMSVDIKAQDGEVFPISIRFGIRREESVQPSMGNGFIGNAVVVPTVDGDGAYIFKTSVRSAWTIDQAVTDAATLRRSLRSWVQ